jgi:hypothetical protein
LAIGLFILVQSNFSQIELVTYWSIIVLVVEIPFTIYFYHLVRKHFPLSLDVIPIIKYMTISIVVFGGIYFLMDKFLEYELSIFNFFPKLIPFLILGVVAYLGLTYLVDKRTMKLFKSVLSEIKRKK